MVWEINGFEQPWDEDAHQVGKLHSITQYWFEQPWDEDAHQVGKLNSKTQY